MITLPTRAVLPADAPGVATTVCGLPCTARGIRVVLLTIALVAMSLVDLYITLLYLQSIGLAEENPFARIVMSHGSPGLLAGWKLMTIMPCVIVLLIYRKRFSVELLAWIACIILLGVTIRWIQYADETDLLVVVLPELQNGMDHRWVSMPN